MSIIEAIVLGIVQGLTEFLPVSSSGHLILVPWLLGWARDPEVGKTFDVALHIGTFVGAVAYFRNDLIDLLRPANRRLGWLLLVSTIPGGITGALLSDTIDRRLGQPWLIAVMLAVFGVVLLAADRYGRREREIGVFGVRDALLIGAAQACALQPGVSRSGATMSMARVLGFERDAATRISFLMSLPIIGGAAAFKGLETMIEGGIPSELLPAFGWGIVASGLTGWVAVWATLRYVRTRSFLPFVVYRLALAALVLAVVAVR